MVYKAQGRTLFQELSPQIRRQVVKHRGLDVDELSRFMYVAQDSIKRLNGKPYQFISPDNRYHFTMQTSGTDAMLITIKDSLTDKDTTYTMASSASEEDYETAINYSLSALDHLNTQRTSTLKKISSCANGPEEI